MRWAGFRKVRRQVCRRIARRMEEVGCADTDAYRTHLARCEEEWRVPGGAFIVGARETPLPGDFEPWLARAGVYEKSGVAKPT
jgi:hypothetical protein